MQQARSDTKYIQFIKVVFWYNISTRMQHSSAEQAITFVMTTYRSRLCCLFQISYVFALKVSWTVRAIFRYQPAKIQCCTRKRMSPVEKQSKPQVGISQSPIQLLTLKALKKLRNSQHMQHRTTIVNYTIVRALQVSFCRIYINAKVVMAPTKTTMSEIKRN